MTPELSKLREHAGAFATDPSAESLRDLLTAFVNLPMDQWPEGVAVDGGTVSVISHFDGKTVEELLSSCTYTITAGSVE